MQEQVHQLKTFTPSKTSMQIQSDKEVLDKKGEYTKKNVIQNTLNELNKPLGPIKKRLIMSVHPYQLCSRTLQHMMRPGQSSGIYTPVHCYIGFLRRRCRVLLLLPLKAYLFKIRLI